MYNVIGMWATKGFTLIELIITISIIAVLSTIGVNTFNGAQKRGRDTRRQSDLNQYRVALENYASVNGSSYPAVSGNASANSGIFDPSASGVLYSYLTGFPQDPRGYDYYFRSDATGSNWVLRGCMESTVLVYEVCSSGKVGTVVGSDCANLSTMTSACSL